MRERLKPRIALAGDAIVVVIDPHQNGFTKPVGAYRCVKPFGHCDVGVYHWESPPRRARIARHFDRGAMR
jgi:hypothetical protein